MAWALLNRRGKEAQVSIMHALTRLVTTLTLSLGIAACSAGMGDTGDPDRPGGSGGDGDSKSLTIAGDYVVKSEFKVTPERLGTSGDLALDLGKLADDPVKEIADMIADEYGISLFRRNIEEAIEEALGSNEEKLSSAISETILVLIVWQAQCGCGMLLWEQ